VLDAIPDLLSVTTCLSHMYELSIGRRGPAHCDCAHRIDTGTGCTGARERALTSSFCDARRNDWQRPLEPEKDDADYEKRDEGFGEDEAAGCVIAAG